MNVALYRRAREVFVRAIELGRAERAALLERECAGDAELRAEVDSLLAAHESQDGFDSISAGAAAHAVPPLETPRLPEQIGSYRVLDLLGEGGMGVVYLAEQDNPRRRVALKVLSNAGGSPARLRRFEREAQFLGRLHHPGIAQVYEAGTADAGSGPQPYLAMELVEGREITDHADALGLDARARIELLVEVCHAVHHAHERGIVHRDLKPANILVDEHGRPKVLDFGIAHASAEDLRTRTLLTGAGEVLGTLPYMSPEQVEGDSDEVDARSDVYALGVIAYRLLSGRLPLEFGRHSLPEAARVIREEEPPFLGTLQRGLRGDLETIVAKALAKERARRYGSALELARDLERWLHSEPIVARPPSTIYQLAKFARRNRVLFLGVAGVFVALILGIAGTSWQAVRATRESEQARRETERLRASYKFLDETLMSADPKQLGRDVKVVDVLDTMAGRVGKQFQDDPASEATIRHTIGMSYFVLGKWKPAEENLRRSLELHRQLFGSADPASARAEYALGRATMSLGNLDEAESLFRESVAGLQRADGRDDEDSLASRRYLGEALMKQGRFDEAEALQRDVLQRAVRDLGAGHALVANAAAQLGIVLRNQGRLDEAAVELERAVAIQSEHSGPEDRETLYYTGELASLRSLQGKHAEAQALLERVLAAQRRLLGPEAPNTLTTMNNLAMEFIHQGQLEPAEKLWSEVLEIRKRVHGDTHPHTLTSKVNLLHLWQDLGKHDESEQLIREIEADIPRLNGGESLQTLVARETLAHVRFEQGRFEEAQAFMGRAVAVARDVLKLSPVQCATFQDFHAICLLKLRRFEEAEAELLQSHAAQSKVAPGLLVELYQAWGKPELAAKYKQLSAAAR